MKNNPNMTEVGNLEEAALERKNRLKVLKNKRTGGDDGPPDKRRADGETLPKPVFRSYKPQDGSLAEGREKSASAVNIEEKVDDQLELSKPQPLVEEIDLINLAPRKPDWDLKRDIAKKLEKLERRTKRAIAELVRERLKLEGDLAGGDDPDVQDSDSDD